jgi:hypothetical protein
MRGDVIPLVLALSAAMALATPSADEPQTGASRVALATVSDPRGRPLLDVGPDDFVIQEGGVAREVLSVRPADYPIIVLLDNGVDARGDFSQMRKAVARFLDRIGQRPVTIGTLGNPPTMISTFDDDRRAVAERLEALEPATMAGSMLMQGAALAGRTMQRTGPLFSAIVILSAAALDASRDAPDEMIASIVDSGAMLHVIANRTMPASVGSGVRTAQTMRVLAEQSRGQYTTIYSSASYQAALDRLAERLTSELLIEYIVPVGSKPVDVKVGIRLAGARVHGLGVAPR